MSPVVSLDPLLDHILYSGLELLEGIFIPSPTDSLRTAFMAAYIASPLAPCSAPLGGLVASLDVSGGSLVVPAGIFSGSIISTMGGIGVQAGASTLNMRGLVVQGGHSSRKKGGPWQSRGYLCNQHFGSSHGLCQPTIILLGSRDPPLLPPSSLAWWFGDTSSLGGIWWLHGCRPFWVAPPSIGSLAGS